MVSTLETYHVISRFQSLLSRSSLCRYDEANVMKVPRKEVVDAVVGAVQAINAVDLVYMTSGLGTQSDSMMSLLAYSTSSSVPIA
jgi:hypothetical protein